MPSFDIISKTDRAEVENAVAGVRREIETRFDFKGSNCTITRTDDQVLLQADDAQKLDQMQELLRIYITRRKLDIGALDFREPEKATGGSLRQTVQIKQGIDAELARTIIRAIKDAKLKVQAAVQGDELRITGKKRDDLQGAIAFVRTMAITQPLQYINFRD